MNLIWVAVGILLSVAAWILPYLLAIILPATSYILYKRGRRKAGITFLTVTLIVPVGWYYVRKVEYFYLCSTAELKVNGRAENVEGILAVGGAAQSAAHDELKAGNFYYIELGRPGDEGGFRIDPDEYAWLKNLTPRQTEIIKQRREVRLSRYTFERTVATDYDWLYPNIQFARLRVLDSKTNAVLAETREYQFGGGIVGWYWAYFITGSPVELCGWNLPRGPGWFQYSAGMPWFTWPFKRLDGEDQRARGRVIAMRDREFLRSAITPVKRHP